MASEAKRRANIAYNKRQDSITIRPNKDKGAEIRQAAKQAGQALQAYIIQAVDQRIQRDRETTPGGECPPETDNCP